MGRLKSLCISLICAGVIVCFIGVYFLMFGAGIPYQDPTTEMTINWLANDLAGTICLKCGGLVIVIGLLGHFIVRVAKWKSE